MIAARAYRGRTVESAHHASIAVSDAEGRVARAFGDRALVTFTRSSLKPYQLLPLVASGAADAHGFTDADLAVMASSHSGEPSHVKIVEGILERARIVASALRCGAHAPYHGPSASALDGEPTPLHNNCSGKHAAMLVLAKHLGAPLDSYLAFDHPVQSAIREAVARFSGARPEALAWGVDGCGAPNYALPVATSARLAACLARPPPAFGPEGEALGRIASAMGRHPYEVAGTDRFDTTLMEVADGRLVAKAGGEGVQLVADLETGLGLFLKIEDGASRAVAPVAIEALRQLGWLEGRAFEVLGDLWRPAIRNHAGSVVGKIEPDFILS